MEEANKGQKSALETLRESIKQKQEIEQLTNDTVKAVSMERIYSLIEVMEVKDPSELSEFDLERYQQLTKNVDILYNNYLTYKQEFLKSSDNMSNGLKELAKAIDETLLEGTKPRF
jgi:hypothetical protein